MIEHVIFDLGNVLINVHPEKAMHALAQRCQKEYQEVTKFYLSSIHMDFMEGKIPPTKFYHTLLTLYECNIPFDEFVDIWNLIIGDAKKGIAEIIYRLKTNGYTLSLCSNTDPWHLEYTRKKCKFLEDFQKFFLSYEMQKIKPAPGVFQHILKELQTSATACVFIDDSIENIRMAEKFGFQTIHADNSTKIRKELKRLKLLNRWHR